jgi:hypothetical protein
MQYGLMTYDILKYFNLGDYIQGLAARQFLPRVDQYVSREKLNEYSGPVMKLIMNGWYMHHPENWPPSSNIIPLFISFHLTKRAAGIMLDEKGISYLKKYSVGARDEPTLDLLKSNGIDSFFSGCLTLTLGESFQHKPGKEIIFVDVLYKWYFTGRRKRLLRKVFTNDILDNPKLITHRYLGRDYPDEESRFQLAEAILKRYQNARLVVTSRLHCALPCLAMGTPVIFIDGYLSSKDRNRFVGLSKLLNTVSICGQTISKNFDLESLSNKDNHKVYVEKLKKKCKEFVNS